MKPDATLKDKLGRWLRYAFYILSFALFIYILWWGGPEAWAQVLSGEWRWLLLALAMQAIANALAAQRLRMTAVSLSGRSLGSWRRFFQLSMTARALGLVLPRGLSTLGGKSVGLRALGVPLQRSLWTVMVDNAFDLGLLVLLALPGVLFFQGTSPVVLASLIVLMVVLAAGVVWWGTAPGRLALLWRGLRRWPWLAQKLNLTEETAVIPLPSPPAALRILGVTFVLNLSIALGYFAIARAIGLVAEVGLFLASFPITQLSLVVAIAPGGLGVFDLGWLGLLRLGGLVETAALAFVIAQRAYIFVIVLLLAGVSWLLGLTDRTITAAKRASS